MPAVTCWPAPMLGEPGKKRAPTRPEPNRLTATRSPVTRVTTKERCAPRLDGPATCCASRGEAAEGRAPVLAFAATGATAAMDTATAEATVVLIRCAEMLCARWCRESRAVMARPPKSITCLPTRL